MFEARLDVRGQIESPGCPLSLHHRLTEPHNVPLVPLPAVKTVNLVMCDVSVYHRHGTVGPVAPCT